MTKEHGNAWPEKKRIEVATAHTMGLSAPMIAAATGVSTETIRHWRMTDWFKDLVDEIQREDDYQADAKLTKIVNKSLDIIVDRLENGEFMWDGKKKEWVRKPLTLLSVTKVSDIMYDKRNLLRGKPTVISGKEQVSDRLLKLAEEFKRFANAKTIQAEVIDHAVQEPSPAEVYVLPTPGHSEAVGGGVPESGSPSTKSDTETSEQKEEVVHAVHDERPSGLQEGIQPLRGEAIGNSQARPTEQSTP